MTVDHIKHNTHTTETTTQARTGNSISEKLRTSLSFGNGNVFNGMDQPESHMNLRVKENTPSVNPFNVEDEFHQNEIDPFLL